MNHERYMAAAYEEGLKGITQKHGGPFGAVVVDSCGNIIGAGHNQVLYNNDPTCHGEIQAIRDACRKVGSFDLSGCVLYTTAYPCPMCQGAIQWAGIKKVYYGCTLTDTDGIGFRDADFYATTPNMEQVEREQCLHLFKQYADMEDKQTYQPDIENNAEQDSRR